MAWCNVKSKLKSNTSRLDVPVPSPFSEVKEREKKIRKRKDTLLKLSGSFDSHPYGWWSQRRSRLGEKRARELLLFFVPFLFLGPWCGQKQRLPSPPFWHLEFAIRLTFVPFSLCSPRADTDSGFVFLPRCYFPLQRWHFISRSPLHFPKTLP